MYSRCSSCRAHSPTPIFLNATSPIVARRQAQYLADIDKAMTDVHAVVFEVVRDVVLDGRDEPPALDAANFFRDHATREQWVFAECLEVAPGLRHANDIDHRREQHILTAGVPFFTDHFAELAREVRIERGRERDGAGSAVAGSEVRMPAGPSASRSSGMPSRSIPGT